MFRLVCSSLVASSSSLLAQNTSYVFLLSALPMVASSSRFIRNRNGPRTLGVAETFRLARTEIASSSSSSPDQQQQQQQPHSQQQPQQLQQEPLKFDPDDEMLALGLSPLVDESLEAAVAPKATATVSAASTTATAVASSRFGSSPSAPSASSSSSLMEDLKAIKNKKLQKSGAVSSDNNNHNSSNAQESEMKQQPPFNVSSSGGSGRSSTAVKQKAGGEERQQKRDSVIDMVKRDANRRLSRMQHLLPEMERRQRTRGILMRNWTKRDVAEIIRKPALTTASSSAAFSFLGSHNSSPVSLKSDKELSVERVRQIVLSETDPLESKAREEINSQFQRAVEKRTEELLAEMMMEESEDGRTNSNNNSNNNNTNDVDDSIGNSSNNYNNKSLRVQRAREKQCRAAAILDVIESMDDAELSAVLKSGAVDPIAVWESENSAAAAANVNDENDDDDLFFSELPAQYLRAERGLALARELANFVQPQNPTDDEAQLVADAEAGNVMEFSLSNTQSSPLINNSNNNNSNGDAAYDESNIKRLEAFERRQSYMYTEQPNAVLQYLAHKTIQVATVSDDDDDDDDAGNDDDKAESSAASASKVSRGDEKIRASLQAMDRAKRSMLRDPQFQAALAHIRMLERQDVENADSAAAPKPRMPKSAVEIAVPFFDPAHSRPPLRALASLPDPEMSRDDRIHDARAVAERRAKKRLTGVSRFFRQRDASERGDEKFSS